MSRDDQQDRQRPSDHVEQFNELPRATKEWLETRRRDDWDKIDKAMDFYDRMLAQEAKIREALAYLDRIRDRGKFFMWIVGGLLSVLFGFGVLSDHIVRLLSYLRGGNP